MKPLDGKLALVTGAAKNVGRVIALELAARGAHILLNYFHSHEEAKQTKAELESTGAKVDLLRASVAQQLQVDRMFEEIRARYGYLDILVNNAANGALVPLEDVTEELLDKALNTNFKGSLWCSRAAAALMAPRGGGSIVNISALGGSQFAMANYLACGPAKAAVESLTRYLAADLAPLNIRVNTASAGMLESYVADSFPRASEMQAAVIRATPLGRLGRPEDLARVVAFLASSDSGWITGQVLLADGGLSLGVPLLSPPKMNPTLAVPAIAASSLAEEPSLAESEVAPQEAAELPAARAAVADEEEGEEIAVVGMGLAVPGASDPEQYWEALVEGGEFFIDVPMERWDNSHFFSPDASAEDKTYQNKSAFITGFEPCPALRKESGEALEGSEFTTLWLRHSLLQALQGVKLRDADRCSFTIGYTADGSQHLEEASVLSGTMARFSQLLEPMEGSAAEKEALLQEAGAVLKRRYARSVSAPSRFLPDRVGKNAMKGVLPRDTEVLMVDTACSSSLYAIDIGVKGLLMGKQEIAICGGAFALAPRGSILFAKLHGISTSGEVRSFDKTSDGVLFADGAGVVVLKKMRRALEDGDAILAVVKAFGASSDGKGKAIYAPSSAGQKIAIERAASHPAVALEQVDWIIAHATGTPAGDLAEFTTLREMIRPDRPVYVTSNKSLIGHTGWAAGVVSVIQAILGIQKSLIPPQHRFHEAPANFELDKTRLEIPTHPVSWPKKAAGARTVSISGFGFGGTNAHLILQEYIPGAAPAKAPKRSYEERIAIIGWSAHLPGLHSRAEVSDWICGKGKRPEASFGDFYPTPRFDKLRIPPGTVRTTDRCQLMIVECAHSLREQLDSYWEKSRGNAGVFVGHMGATRNAILYGSRCYLDEIGTILSEENRRERFPLLPGLLDRFGEEMKRLVPPSTEDSFPGSMPNVIPARVANYFDLKGPNMTVDTGFSSTLAAAEVASRYLRANEIEMALVGGINGNSLPEMMHTLGEASRPAATALGEGAFLFALVTETAARKNHLPILGYLEEFRTGDGPAPNQTARAGDWNYLGAQSALDMLRALHLEKAETRIVCDDAEAATACSMIFRAPGVSAPAAPSRKANPATIPTRFFNDGEYAPGKPIDVIRHIARLRPLALQLERPPLNFIPPRTLILTDRPDLAAQLPRRTGDQYIFSTKPTDAASSGSIYIPIVTEEAVKQQLAALNARVEHIRLVTSLGTAGDGSVWSESESIVALHDLAFLALKHCGQGLADSGGSFIALFLNAVSSGCPHPFAGLFGGLAKCAAFELRGCLTFALFTDLGGLPEAARQAESESAARRLLPVVFYESGARSTMVLDPVPATLSADTPARLDSGSVIAAVAGARGITAELLKALAKHWRPVLYLIGSNPIDSYPPDIFEGSDEEFGKGRQQFIREQKALYPQKNLGTIDKEFNRMADARASRRNIAEMEAWCGAGRVHYLSCNVLDGARVRETFDHIFQAEGKLDLVINAAGLNRSAPIVGKSLEEFRSIRDLKLRGYLHLKGALKDRAPRMWCNFGSLLGFTGQIGEADYASGNDFLATAATYSNQRLGADEFTIGWTLWGEVGLGAKPLTKAYFEKTGMYSNMATEQGVHHFVRELNLPSHAPSIVHAGAAEKAAINNLIPGYFAVESSAPAKLSGSFYLDRVLESSADHAVFERVFDLDRDSYLTQHLVNGFATLPGTFVTEIAAEAASRLAPGFRVVAFEDLVFQHFLRVYERDKPSPKKISARVIERSDDHALVQIRITTDIVAPGGQVLTKDKLHFALNVVLAKQAPHTPQWEQWDAAGEVPVPDPYHFPAAPALLTGIFASTSNTRLHPLGKRSEYGIAIDRCHPAISTFRVPCILLDGLARTGVLSLYEGEYLPLVAPSTIRRIDLYEEVNDCDLANGPGPIELYATPREFSLDSNGGSNRFVATRPDGRVIVQIKDVVGTLLGYVHRVSGDFVTVAAMDAREKQELLVASR
jgi:NAD(P)-dependent dehydrogenase (short-subunit alcohol dehydrogenase family)/3-oxoacyl-(acyl-carrier-protein) synthase